VVVVVVVVCTYLQAGIHVYVCGVCISVCGKQCDGPWWWAFIVHP